MHLRVPLPLHGICRTFQLAAVCSSLGSAALYAAPGDVDLTFNSNVQGNVYGVAMQLDNKLVIASDVSGRYIGRLNTTGLLDSTFTGDANNWVVSTAMQPDGKILLSGTFSTVRGSARRGIARLNADGSLDTGFNANLGGTFTEVFCIAVQPDGKILIGGAFTTVGGIPRARIARLNPNGTPDTNFIINASDSVYNIAIQPDGKILLAGSFTSIQDDNGLSDSRNFIARLNPDGSTDPLFNPGCDNTVYCMAVQPDGKILVGGPLTQAVGVDRTYLARINEDGTIDAEFNPVLDGLLYSLALQADGKILIAGQFFNVGGESRQRIARLNSDGSTDTTFNTTVDNLVHSATLQGDGKLIIAGYFSSVGGESRSYIARLQNDLAPQSIQVTGTSRIQWFRGGSSPEAQDVIFETSTNGSTWTPRGSGTRIPGGWEVSGLSLPASGQVRARARTPGGYYSGSSGMVQFATTYPQSSIDAWRQQYFGSTANSGNGANTTDYDKDGLQNFVEFAYGLDPTLAVSNQVPQATLDGENLSITFTQPAGVSGVTYKAEWSSSLTAGTWTNIPNTGTAPEYKFSTPVAGKPRLYIRHRVSIP